MGIFRERQIETRTSNWVELFLPKQNSLFLRLLCEWTWISFHSLCVCVCVCERERERERESKRNNKMFDRVELSLPKQKFWLFFDKFMSQKGFINIAKSLVAQWQWLFSPMRRIWVQILPPPLVVSKKTIFTPCGTF